MGLLLTFMRSKVWLPVALLGMTTTIGLSLTPMTKIAKNRPRRSWT